MDLDDPLDWSIDDVVQQLCYTKDPSWALGTELKPVQDPKAIEDALRQNDINGDDLLALKDSNLKDDLAISSFGKRRRISNIIEHLRKISSKYQPHSSPSVHALPIWQRNDLPITPASRSDKTNPQQIEFPSTSTTLRISREPKSDVSTGPVTICQRSESEQELAQTQPCEENNSEAQEEIGSTFLDVLEESLDDALGGAVGQPEQSLRHPVDSHEQGYVPVGERKRRRIMPTLVSTLSDSVLDRFHLDQLMSQSSVPDPESKFRSKNARPEALLQERIRSLVDERETSIITDCTIENQEFLIFGSQTPTSGGVGRSACRQMINSMRMPITIIDKQTWAVGPSTKRMKRGEKMYMTIFKEGSVPKQQLIPDLGEAVKTSHRDHTHDADTFQNLLLLYPPEDDSGDALPLYGDSDDEDKYSSQESVSAITDGEDRAHCDQQSTPAPLTEIQIRSILDEAVRDYVVSWEAHNRPRIQKKAWNRWMQTSAHRPFRQAMLEGCLKQRDHTIKRLLNLRNNIHESGPWTKSSSVRQQCESLQVTVEQREEYQLYVDVLKSDIPPRRPSGQSLERPRQSVPKTAEDEDTCESEHCDIDSDTGDIEAAEDERKPKHELDDDHSSRRPASFLAQRKSPVRTTLQIQELSHLPDRNHVHVPRRLPGVPMTAMKGLEHLMRLDDVDSGEAPFLQDLSRRRVALETYETSSSITNFSNAAKSSRLTGTPDIEISDEQLNPSNRLIDPEHMIYSQEPICRLRGPRAQDVIDLTTSSPPQQHSPVMSDHGEMTEALTTPSKTTTRARSNSVQRLVDHRDFSVAEMKVYSYKQASSTSWVDIETDMNHSLALAKTVYHLNTNDVQSILDFAKAVLNPNGMGNIHDVLKEGLGVLKLDDEDGDKWRDVPKKNQEVARVLTAIYISCACCEKVVEPDDVSEEQCDEAFALVEDLAMPFVKLLIRLLNKTIHGAPETRRSGYVTDEASLITDGGTSTDAGSNDSDVIVLDDPLRSKSRSKTRKGEAYNKHVACSQNQAQKRMQEMENFRNRMAKTAAALPRVPHNRTVDINFTDPIISIPNTIAKLIKPHQERGIQFMWREIVNDQNKQGCLLAHTMGLGKTMQVITTLVTIAFCNQSNDRRIADLIPDHLRKLLIMIICPSGLVENWYDELALWMPDKDILGPIYKVISSKSAIKDIEAWSKQPGVLLLSYERFQRLANPSHPNNPQETDQFRRLLLGAPTLVVADEAHKLKNHQSRIAKTARQIITKSRIALTGSPLSNHLDEYYAMIDFVAPGYLGSSLEFKAKFTEVIDRSLEMDSNVYQRRMGLKKMRILKEILAPKVNRADISAISMDMPPKTEFYITVSLTEEQRKAYTIYVQHFRNTKFEGRGANARLWDWLAVLSLLCNHPSTFVQKLKDKQAQSSRRIVDDTAGNETFFPDDVDLTLDPALSGVMAEAVSVFDDRQVQDPILSHRMLITTKIVSYARSLDEKTLIFTHSIPTLNYLEAMLTNMRAKFKRIDGSVSVFKRQQAVKNFNTEGTDAEVFIISTRAGGLGLNLQGATRVVILDYGFNPTWEEQAIGRAYRLGQRNPVFVYRFKAGGTYEDVMFNKSVFKTQLFSRIVDHKTIVRRGKKTNPGEYLFNPIDIPQESLSECTGKDLGVLDRILADPSIDCVRKIDLTETFTQEIDETLNTEELREVEEEVKLEQLRLSNPQAYENRLNVIRARQMNSTITTTPTSTNNSNTIDTIPGLSEARQAIHGAPQRPLVDAAGLYAAYMLPLMPAADVLPTAEPSRLPSSVVRIASQECLSRTAARTSLTSPEALEHPGKQHGESWNAPEDDSESNSPQ